MYLPGPSLVNFIVQFLAVLLCVSAAEGLILYALHRRNLLRKCGASVLMNVVTLLLNMGILTGVAWVVYHNIHGSPMVPDIVTPSIGVLLSYGVSIGLETTMITRWEGMDADRALIGAVLGNTVTGIGLILYALTVN